ncbi:D-lactaldehyde dehydrogenase [Dichomitus squalens LYAD-421 SS1]|uniref:D-lactaldehyde dehydrogenase n=1 Tax=Dichomitus squalens (strain LYAD-421) TaxID=732165 RepID=R7SJR2_DICSQ|nr:D-lactaldehyde dehydrogenase [Dichomitus squalens LYAD-421 SS1]EJF56384.1 D-lactaldehyde dehydrogenase [Dichomitus squalens LYAD-421 SS1]
MPAISVPGKILITGANGFIGLWVIRLLLQRGYSVRAAVRSADKGENLLKTITAKIPEQAQNVEYIVVPDITAEHAFDEAVRGIVGIVHTASPMGMPGPDPQTTIGPAVSGTEGLLNSAITHAPLATALTIPFRDAVKRVVITSSIKAAIGTDSGRTYTEEDWADYAVKEVEEKGRNVNFEYTASGVLAERAAWKFYEENKERVSWDISVTNPGWPTLDDPSSPATLATTPKLFYEVFTGNPMYTPLAGRLGHNFVDVRNVAEAHLKALEIEEAGGQRFILASEWHTWQDRLNTARDLNYFPNLDKGDPARANSVSPPRICHGEKAKRMLGISYRKMPETLRDVLDDYRARGWLAKYE